MVRGVHFECEGGERRIVLTEAGALRAESLLGCGNLFEPAASALLSALVQAIHAHALLARDVDYIVRDGVVALVDEAKGRVDRLRRWPEGLQAAVEVKEAVAVQHAGRILGAITLQSFVSLYPRVCGMTGTAATQATELREVYALEVAVVPTNRPVIRRDLPDVVHGTREEKHAAVVARIREAHERGRPVLVGTASVAESEALGRRLERERIPHAVLNARNEESEAQVVRQAGRPGAVTISTNMAGRGTDILLGGDPPLEHDRVAAAGGLLVIGTNRHESRRIDNQLRGRAGRQGDPGETQFHVSLDDELFARFGLDRQTDLDHAQRVIEGQHLDVRLTLLRYERIVELQRRIVHAERRSVLAGDAESILERELPERHADLAGRARRGGVAAPRARGHARHHRRGVEPVPRGGRPDEGGRGVGLAERRPAARVPAQCRAHVRHVLGARRWPASSRRSPPAMARRSPRGPRAPVRPGPTRRATRRSRTRWRACSRT